MFLPMPSTDGRGQRRRIPADDKGQRAGCRAGRAAGHRRIHHRHAGSSGSAATSRATSAEMVLQSISRLPDKAFEHAVLAQIQFADMAVGRQHGDDDIRLTYGIRH
jgi:hypothetical protein